MDLWKLMKFLLQLTENFSAAQDLFLDSNRTATLTSTFYFSLHFEQEFLCAINGHVMKEPVKAPSGLVFEQATIGTSFFSASI